MIYRWRTSNGKGGDQTMVLATGQWTTMPSAAAAVTNTRSCDQWREGVSRKLMCYQQSIITFWTYGTLARPPIHLAVHDWVA
jgi:hypothetical protein